MKVLSALTPLVQSWKFQGTTWHILAVSHCLAKSRASAMPLSEDPLDPATGSLHTGRW